MQSRENISVPPQALANLLQQQIHENSSSQHIYLLGLEVRKGNEAVNFSCCDAGAPPATGNQDIDYSLASGCSVKLQVLEYDESFSSVLEMGIVEICSSGEQKRIICCRWGENRVFSVLVLLSWGFWLCTGEGLGDRDVRDVSRGSVLS